TRRSISPSCFLRYVYSAFSERSPSAAAAASARTTSGRVVRHRRSSSSARRRCPARVMTAVARGAGGRQRLTSRRTRSQAFQDGTEAAAHDLAAIPPHFTLDHGFEHALTALGAEQPAFQHFTEPGFGVFRGTRFSVCLGRLRG